MLGAEYGQGERKKILGWHSYSNSNGPLPWDSLLGLPELEFQKDDLLALVGGRKQNHCKTQQAVYNESTLWRLKDFLRKCISAKERDSLRPFCLISGA